MTTTKAENKQQHQQRIQKNLRRAKNILVMMQGDAQDGCRAAAAGKWDAAEGCADDLVSTYQDLGTIIKRLEF